MKKLIASLFLLFAFTGCNINGVEKPENLIGRDKMVDILYDISLLEGIKNQNINGGLSNKKAMDYVSQKYQVDSTRLAESNMYYASDIEEYKKMLGEIKDRLKGEMQKAEEELKKEKLPGNLPMQNKLNPDTPQIE